MKTLVLIAFSFVSVNALSNPVFLDSDGLCHMKISGFELKGARVYAHPDQMLALLLTATIFDAHSCVALLTGASNEVDYIMEKNVKQLGPSDRFSSISSSTIILQSPSAQQFVNLYSHMGGGGTPPNSSDGDKPKGSSLSEVDDCKLEGEVCISSSGETSFQAACGGVSLTVTTTGGVTVGAKGEREGISLKAN